MKPSYLDPIQAQKIERIKELLKVPCEERTEKMCLELMSFTKDFKLFENISMSIEHQNVCSTMTLNNFKPNEVIVKQGDPGDSFFYILHGTVNIRLASQIDTGIKEEGDSSPRIVTIEKNVGVLKDGQTFGELALLYGTPRSASIVAVTNSSLIKIDKEPFDKYVKNIFENQLQDQIEFLKICPIFQKINKDELIKLGVRTEIKKFSTGQTILESNNKVDKIYIIRRGGAKVTREIKFIKNDRKLRKERSKKLTSKQFTDFEDLNNRQQIENDKMIELLSAGPSEEDIKSGNYISKEITLETLKIGDIFPSYYAINSLYLDVRFEADTPCEFIAIKLSDIQEIVPDTYDFIKKYAKPYPGEEFLRKFYYYNDAWNKYKNALKYNILADSINKKSISKNDMRTKIYQRKDLNSFKLPSIFGAKNMNFK
jgi:CRP-like cAMP-binding protein